MKKFFNIAFASAALLMPAAVPPELLAAEPGATFTTEIGEGIMYDNNTPATFSWVVNEDRTTLTLNKIKVYNAGVPPTAMKNGYSLNIPGEIAYEGETFTVTAMGNSTIYQCPFLKSVTFPESMKTIGNSNFEIIRDLETIDLGGVKTIGSNCFYSNSGQDKLTSLDLSNVTSIGGNSFSGLKGLKEVELSPDLENLGSGVFSDCPDVTINMPEGGQHVIIDGIMYKQDETRTYPVQLVQVLPDFKSTSITLPETVTTLTSSAFRGNATLESVNLSNVTSLPYGIFWGCTALKEVVGADNLESIGEYAFYNCSSLESFNIGPKVTTITLTGSRKSFLGCTGLKEFTIDESNPDYSATEGVVYNKEKTKLISYMTDTREKFEVPAGVTSVGDYAFYTQLSNLKEIVYGNDVETIGTSQFYNSSYPNESLTRLVFGEKVKSAGNSAFTDAKNVMEVVSYAVVPPTLPGYPFNYNTFKDGKLICPTESIDAYKVAGGWNRFAADNIVTGIGSAAAESHSEAYFTLDGKPAAKENLAPGIYIVRTGDKTRKAIVK